MSKADLRAQMAQTLKQNPPTAADGAALLRNLQSLPRFQAARTVGAFMPLPGEPDLSPLFGLPGKRFYIPAFDPADGRYILAALQGPLRTGRYGIPEPAAPVPAAALDLILVPGTAFDLHGGRLGRGGGFYDRILAAHPSAVPVGLCFERQLTDRLPAEPHDRPMAWIVTESRIAGPLQEVC